MIPLDLTKLRFGRLVVIERAPNINRYRAWYCKCDCGKTPIVRTDSLRSRKAQSCGCLAKEHRLIVNKIIKLKHGAAIGAKPIRLYRIWRGMKGRCLRETEPAYINYGGRGIHLYPGWMEFVTFEAWALSNGYSDDLQIDRINNDGGYEPSNCRWVTGKVNCNNRRSSKKFIFNGELLSSAEAGRKYGIDRTRIRQRILSGMEPNEAIKIETAAERELRNAEREAENARICAEQNKKTHCRLGHKYSIVREVGDSYCKQCARARKLRAIAARQKRLQVQGAE